MKEILDPLHPLQSAVLESLGKRGPLTASELLDEISTKYGLIVSLKNLYRLLARLVEVQVLTKSDKEYSLNAIWLSNVKGFLSNAILESSRREKSGSMLDLPRRSGDVRTYIAMSLSELDPVWNNVLGSIAATASKKEWIFFNSHPWYSLASPATEHRLFQGLRAQKIRLHAVYGNRCFLDHYGAHEIRVPGVKVHLLEAPPFRGDGYILWICEQYVMEMTLSSALTERFETFFENVKSIKEFDPGAFADIFKMRSQCKLEIKYDSKLASALSARLGIRRNR